MGKKEAKKFMQMRKDETDPDNIAIIDLDIQRELGLDPKELQEMLGKIKVKGRSMGGLSGTGEDMQNYMADEASAAGNSKGGGAAIKGIKFTGLK